MAERIILLTGSQSDLFGDPFVPPQMIEDLLVVAKVSREEIDRLTTALESAIGFLDEEKLKQFVQDAIPDRRAASAVLSAIQNLRPGRVDQVLNSLSTWRQANGQNAQRLPDDTFTAIQDKLRGLIRPYPAWDRFRKARRLASVTGNKARQVELICDVRPVFDPDRLRIEGFVPLTTLKLVYETQTEETGCVELLLSVHVLEELLDKAKKAQSKMKTLRNSLNQWIPDSIVDP